MVELRPSQIRRTRSRTAIEDIGQELHDMEQSRPAPPLSINASTSL
jgi:hypothetical protein